MGVADLGRALDCGVDGLESRVMRLATTVRRAEARDWTSPQFLGDSALTVLLGCALDGNHFGVRVATKVVDVPVADIVLVGGDAPMAVDSREAAAA